MIVNGTNITIVRGDTDSLTVACNMQGETFPFVTGDAVFFTVKENATDSVEKLQKTVTEFVDGKAIFEFTAEDTRDMRFKDYLYDVRLVTHEADNITIVQASVFTVAVSLPNE